MGAYVRAYLKRPAAAGVFSSMLLFLSAPAEAHHPGGGGNTGSGVPINTISADTLPEGLIAASVRYEFIHPQEMQGAQVLARGSKEVSDAAFRRALTEEFRVRIAKLATIEMQPWRFRQNEPQPEILKFTRIGKEAPNPRELRRRPPVQLRREVRRA